MKNILRAIVLPILLSLVFSPAWADKFSDTKTIFEGTGVGDMFKTAFGYALFPTIGKAGFIVGGAFGSGRVYEQGVHIGDTEMTQITAGLQAGGTGFSQVIFFEDDQALEKFTSGNFEFSVKAQAVVLTASADVSGGTSGNSATASGGKNNAIIEGGHYIDGMATFTITKGGLMYEVTIGGQKFKYKKL